MAALHRAGQKELLENDSMVAEGEDPRAGLFSTPPPAVHSQLLHLSLSQHQCVPNPRQSLCSELEGALSSGWLVPKKRLV